MGGTRDRRICGEVRPVRVGVWQDTQVPTRLRSSLVEEHDDLVVA